MASRAPSPPMREMDWQEFLFSKSRSNVLAHLLYCVAYSTRLAALLNEFQTGKGAIYTLVSYTAHSSSLTLPVHSL